MADILNQIIEQKKIEIHALKNQIPLNELKETIQRSGLSDVRSFCGKLKNNFSILAEVKKGSPSKGIIAPDFDPVKTAQAYQSAGADGISVLTDEKFFFGHSDFLSEIRKISDIPLLRKDFMIDEYQIFRSRVLGADLVLLIVAALDDQKLRELNSCAHDLGMEVLIEIHNREELVRAAEIQPDLLGVNNRNLKDFSVDLNRSFDLISSVPQGINVISESGIASLEDLLLLKQAGFHGALIGESLMRAQDQEAFLRELKNG